MGSARPCHPLPLTTARCRCRQETLSHSWWYHWKHEDLLRHNPEHQLVPTLVTPDGRAVFESVICIEFIDELARGLAHGTAAPWLLPDDPVERAVARAWSDRVNRSLCSPYYTILVRQEAAEREEGHATLLKGLARFSEELELRGGPFFFGDQVSIVDLTLVPWAFRYYVLPECCGPEFAVPRGDERLAPFWRWFDAIMACAQTLLESCTAAFCLAQKRETTHGWIWVVAGCRRWRGRCPTRPDTSTVRPPSPPVHSSPRLRQ